MKDIEPNEYQICFSIKQFCDLHHLPLIHFCNEGLRSKITGKRLKNIGLIPGASDYFFMHRNHKGMFMEVKTKKGKLNQSQLEFLTCVNNLGYYGIVCYGLDACIDEIQAFYNIS